MMSYDTVMIVCSGEDYSADKIRQYAAVSDYIIASDGGYDILTECGITPDIIMGDMDSTRLSSDIDNAECEVMRYPAEKDYTDSELSIQKALTFSPKHIYMFASTGSYIDHSLVNIISVIRNAPICRIVTSNAVISYESSSFDMATYPRRRFSLFPTEHVRNIKLIGAKYQYPKCDLAPWEFSLGNEAIGGSVSVQFDEGHIICILFD